MASRIKFPVYRGEKPFIFISYAHADSAVVLPIAQELYRRKYRVWYDGGIEAGSRWAEFVANHLLGASCVMLFPSAQFDASRNCERELNFAVDAKKHMACVALDEAERSPGLKMQLSTIPCISRLESPEQTVDALIASGVLGEELIGDWVEGYQGKEPLPPPPPYLGLIVGIVGIVLALAFGLALFGYSRGWFGKSSGLSRDQYTISQNEDGSTEQVEVTTWNSAVMRDLLISQTEGEALYCCGNAFVSARSGISYRDGAFLVADQPVAQGDIQDLDAVSKLKNLAELSLCHESITDVSALSSLAELTYLDLSGNDLTDISPLTGLKNLAILKLSHTGVSDLLPARSMPALKLLYISYDMVPYAKDILGGAFELIVTE
mgnify:CR=1 FL=1